MGTHVETFPARHTARNIWVTIGVLALLALGLGTGVAIGRATVEEPAPPPEPLGLASTEVVQAIDAQIVALNAADETAYAATWAKDGVFTRMIGPGWVEAWGIDEIEPASFAEDVYPGDWKLERTSEVAQIGDFAATAFTCANGSSGIAVFQLDDDLKIAHQWVMGPSWKWMRGCFG